MNQPLKVMVVDDDVTVLEVTAAVLEQHGYEVRTRESALGTSLAIIREKPDVVLLDVHMPGLSGDRLAELMAPRPGRVAPLVILHSATTLSDLEQLAAGCGAADVMEKTANPSAFIKRFESILVKHAAALPRKPSSSRRS
ncbi:MAG TPA: response regulator [Polyangiaceae bacterium]|nr:response regulator [Polyangiaceae bacterium]